MKKVFWFDLPTAKKMFEKFFKKKSDNSPAVDQIIYTLELQHKFSGKKINYFDNQLIILVIFQAKISNFCWF